MKRSTSKGVLPSLPDWSGTASEAWAITTARRILERSPTVEAARSSGEVLALRIALWRAGVPLLHREKTLELVRFSRSFEWPLAVRAVSARALDAVKPLDEARRDLARAAGAWTAPFVHRAPTSGTFEVVLLSGLPGAGKDHFARTQHPELPVISLDALRDEHQLAHGEPSDALSRLAFDRADALLNRRTPFLWNSTLLRARDRFSLVRRFTQRGARVTIVSLDVSSVLQRRRNRGRASVVPAIALERMLARWEPVMPGEANQERFFEDGVERSFG